jgi:hypothetical protein
MTRLRLVITSCLVASLLAVLLLMPGGGEAGEGSKWTLTARCTTQQDTSRDFVTIRSTLRHRSNGRLRRARGKLVRSRLKDLVPENGNDVAHATDRDRTNRRGVAVTRHEFRDFGNYRVTVRAFNHGRVVATKEVHFGTPNSTSGKCDPPGAPGEEG